MTQSNTKDLDYEKNNIGYDSQYPQGGIKCKNYEVCDAVLPDWWWDCKACYLCTTCDMMFGTWGTEEIGNDGKGTLEFIDNYECVICMETKRCVSQPKCNHFVCIDCFKRCYYGDDESGRPEFPYPEIKEEYDDDEENPKWDNYPLIARYNQEWNEWDDNRMEKYEREKNLRSCPLCRK